MPTPIYIISGFLGAGKTTLINNLLESAPRNARIMVLVNEFGSISIDKKIIETDPLNIVDLSGGCICCGLITEFISSLRFALDEFRADVILVESTGLALPQEIARQALSPFFEGRVEGGGIITVVDSRSVLTEDHPIVRGQIEAANVIVLNKVDLVAPEALVEIRDRIKTMTTPSSILVETTFGKISYHDLLTRRYENPHFKFQKTQPEEFDSTSGFTTLSLVRHSPVDTGQLVAFYQKHHPKIIRSKGFVQTEKGGVRIQVSRSGIEVKEVQETINRTELVLIVKEEDKAFVDREIRKTLG